MTPEERVANLDIVCGECNEYHCLCLNCAAKIAQALRDTHNAVAATAIEIAGSYKHATNDDKNPDVQERCARYSNSTCDIIIRRLEALKDEPPQDAELSRRAEAAELHAKKLVAHNSQDEQKDAENGR